MHDVMGAVSCALFRKDNSDECALVWQADLPAAGLAEPIREGR